MTNMTLPEISIIIATYQRVNFLARLLDILNCQTVRKGSFEVIVVNNASEEINDRVHLLCNRQAYAGLNLTYIHHPILGVSAARNRGAAATTSELIGFLDDDTLPSRDWVKRAVTIYAEIKALIIGGPFTPFCTCPVPKWFRDSYGSLDLGKKPRWLGRNEYLAGANMVINRELFNQLGGFLEEYGYFGAKKFYGEDTEFQHRAMNAGARIWYAPELNVQHYFPREHMKVGWFFSSSYRHGQSKARIHFQEWHTSDYRPKYRQLLSLVKVLILNSVSVIGSLFMLPFHHRQKYPYWQNYAVEFVSPRTGKLGLSVKLFELYLSGDNG